MRMTQVSQSVESLAVEFFQQSAGEWKSQRRYYTLNKETEPQEVESRLSVTFLEQGAPQLIELAQSHQLDEIDSLICGCENTALPARERGLQGAEVNSAHSPSPSSRAQRTQVTWESNYTGQIRKPSSGSTVFGVKGNILYRDRGFATPNPVIATFSFTNPQTMCLRTEYKGSVFEEEIKLVGQNYRTRQTIISRAGQEIMIGQYLEKRLLNAEI
ncbi:phycobiliprotein lyase [Pleurocapsales cyanobacterium LEGE 06147]|nr:phycobiliprotein lyase [Pleurocapsales cyanobacterium LEGE 06147]